MTYKCIYCSRELKRIQDIHHVQTLLYPVSWRGILLTRPIYFCSHNCHLRFHEESKVGTTDSQIYIR